MPATLRSRQPEREPLRREWAVAGLAARRWLAAFLLAVAGVTFSAYLTYLELFVLGAACAYCIVSALLVAALFGLLLAGRPRATGRRSPLRPARVAALGIAMAVGTVAFGAAAFGPESSREIAGVQETLARHLAASGAVMYGAYW